MGNFDLQFRLATVACRLFLQKKKKKMEYPTTTYANHRELKMFWKDKGGLTTLITLCWYSSLFVHPVDVPLSEKGTELITLLLISLKAATVCCNVCFTHRLQCLNDHAVCGRQRHDLYTLKTIPWFDTSYKNCTLKCCVNSSVNDCAIISNSSWWACRRADILNGVHCPAWWQVGGNTIKSLFVKLSLIMDQTSSIIVKLWHFVH